MQIVIDISKDRYDEIMSMDWVNGRRFFDEELRAIHDGKALEQEPIIDKIRAEIELHRRKTESIDPYDLVGDCLDIIDKYMAEGSDKE